MSCYHDFNYVVYILNLPYIEGLEIYNKCIGRFNDKILFELFKIELTRGSYEGSFEDYKKMQNSKQETISMTYEERELEEKRIIDKVEKIIEMDKRRNKKWLKMIN